MSSYTKSQTVQCYLPVNSEMSVLDRDDSLCVCTALILPCFISLFTVP